MSRLDYFSSKRFDCCFDYLDEIERQEVIQDAQHYDDEQYRRHLQEEQFYKQYED
jgi:hypothetical protein